MGNITKEGLAGLGVDVPYWGSAEVQKFDVSFGVLPRVNDQLLAFMTLPGTKHSAMRQQLQRSRARVWHRGCQVGANLAVLGYFRGEHEKTGVGRDASEGGALFADKLPQGLPNTIGPFQKCSSELEQPLLVGPQPIPCLIYIQESRVIAYRCRQTIARQRNWIRP